MKKNVAEKIIADMKKRRGVAANTSAKLMVQC